MRKKEYLIFEERFKEDSTVYYSGSGKGIHHFIDLYENGDLYVGDSPDMVLMHDNYAIIMEHFQFDSYPVHKKKGSMRAREEARIDRVYDEMPASEEGVIFHDQIRVNNSYEDYVNNVCKNFVDHYNKIEQYKRNLVASGLVAECTSTKMMFVIEDVSKLGTYVLNEQKELLPLYLSQCREFLSLLSRSPMVDYVLCFASAGGNDYACFIDREDLSFYEEDACDYANMRFLPIKPRIIMLKKNM